MKSNLSLVQAIHLEATVTSTCGSIPSHVQTKILKLADKFSEDLDYHIKNSGTGGRDLKIKFKVNPIPFHKDGVVSSK